MQGEITIRPAVEADIASVVDLWVEFMDLHSDLDRWFETSPESPKLFEEFARERLADPSSIIIVAEDGDNIVGHAIASTSERPAIYVRTQYATITDVAVTASARRSGVGARLTQEIIGILRDRGITRIEIGVLVGNALSTAFWAKMGFVPYMEKCCLDFEDMSFVRGQSVASAKDSS